MKPEEFTLNLKRVRPDIERWTRLTAPRVAGKIAADHFTENFRKQGFVNGGLRRWKMVRRKEVEPKTRRRRTLAGRPILTGDTADLGRGVGYEVGRARATVFNDVSYARVHNRGVKNAGRDHNVVIPKRLFMGDSEELNKKIEKEIKKKLKRLSEKR